MTASPQVSSAPIRPRTALVLSGGGSRGAYEAGVLSVLFEEIYPELPPGFEFDVVSGTSVGSIHAAYVAASAHLQRENPKARSESLLRTWREMKLTDVLRLSGRDWLGVPMRALGLRRMVRRIGRPYEADVGEDPPTRVVGGLVDLSPLERLIAERVPWSGLKSNLASRRPGALCVSCTEVRSGRITVFMDGPEADLAPWAFDPNAQAVQTRLHARHVRASAAIPFLFPAVEIGGHYYVDGGLRMNTPLSPALRLRADRAVVVALKHSPDTSAGLSRYDDEVVTQPSFLIGKVLNALMLDQLEYELHRVELVNAWIDEGTRAFGDGFLLRINEAVQAERGVGYRPVGLETIRPSEDLGQVAAACYRKRGGRLGGLLPSFLMRMVLKGVPEDEADLLSYLYFDRCFTAELVELGRQDARARKDEILELLAEG